MAQRAITALTAGLLLALATAAPVLAAGCQVTPGTDGLILEAQVLSIDAPPRMTQVRVGQAVPVVATGVPESRGIEVMVQTIACTRIQCKRH